MKTDSFKQFMEMLNKYPKIAEYWNEETECIDFPSLSSDMGKFSNNEKHMAMFFSGVWSQSICENSFDIINAVQDLNPKDLKVITDWINNPVFP